MKIVSWNVNGIRACYKKNLQAFVSQEQPNILCLQETKAHIEQVEPPAQLLQYKFSQWSSAVRKGYSGVATFYNDDVTQVERGIGKPEYDSEGRIVMTRHEHFELYNIYFPNGGSGEVRHQFKQRFLKDLFVTLQSKVKKGQPIVVVGDYNIAHTSTDIYDPVKLDGESGFMPEERQWMDEFFALGFVDTFRYLHPHEQQRFSWWSYRELARVGNRGWRIDYIAITKNLQKSLVNADILDQVEGSDHCPVVATLQL